MTTQRTGCCSKNRQDNHGVDIKGTADEDWLLCLCDNNLSYSSHIWDIEQTRWKSFLTKKTQKGLNIAKSSSERIDSYAKDVINK